MSITTSPLFTPVTIATAPQASKALLENIRRSLGFIPNMMATFANNPIVLQGYLALEDVFERGSFTPKERQIILLATSVENDRSYCTAAHSTIAQSFLYT
jgi:alkylhydroperoxidase/carboxymuconolactone decarboxylase family protein YurZ